MVLYNGRDGLSRQKRSDDIKVVCPFRILEDDSFSLLTRALENASFIRYFNSENTPEGYWKALYLKQSIVVLSEVRIHPPWNKNLLKEIGNIVHY